MPTRRRVLAVGLAGLAGLAGLSTLTGCARSLSGVRAVIATGSPQGVYARLGDALAPVWAAELGVAASTLPSQGSVDNVALLAAGRADVAFCAADVAVEAADAAVAPTGGLRALARVHDDVVQLVVRAESPVVRLGDLRGRRLASGAPNSGVAVIAPRLLATVGLVPGRDVETLPMDLGDSITALDAGRIDAFLWSGGLPTAGVASLSGRVRLVDLGDETAALREPHPVYERATVPARTYGIAEAVTTVAVRNVLLVPAAMPDDLAGELTRVLLERRDALVVADPAGRTIDVRAAVGTQPVALHPGAVAWYRTAKDA